MKRPLTAPTADNRTARECGRPERRSAHLSYGFHEILAAHSSAAAMMTSQTGSLISM
jgi:hypothetical protein